MIGTGLGMKRQPTNLVAQTIGKEIEVYESQLDEPNEVFIPLSERETSDSSALVQHNNISQFGHDAGEMIKTGVREALRYCIMFIDQLISE